MNGTSETTGSDEKTCPFCAETIKAAAIRCRYCGSDLPEAEPEEQRMVVEPTPAAPEASAEAAPRSRRPIVLAAVLAVLVALAAVVFVRMLAGADEEPAVVQGNHPSAPGAEVVSEGAKSAALTAATEATEAVLSYSAKTLEEDMESAEGKLGGPMAKEYAETMAAIREQTEKDEVAVEASVMASSIISAGDESARALLFVNQTTTGKHLPEPRVDLNRVAVSLERDGGRWILTDLTAF